MEQLLRERVVTPRRGELALEATKSPKHARAAAAAVGGGAQPRNLAARVVQLSLRLGEPACSEPLRSRSSSKRSPPHPRRRRGALMKASAAAAAACARAPRARSAASRTPDARRRRLAASELAAERRRLLVRALPRLGRVRRHRRRAVARGALARLGGGGALARGVDDLPAARRVARAAAAAAVHAARSLARRWRAAAASASARPSDATERRRAGVRLARDEALAQIGELAHAAGRRARGGRR